MTYQTQIETLTEISLSTFRNIDMDVSFLNKRNNAFTTMLEKKGRIYNISGGYELQEPLVVPSGLDVQNYSGYDPFEVRPTEDVTAALYTFVQKVWPVTMSGRELLENNGKEAYIDLFNTKVENGCMSIMNSVNTGCMSNGADPKEIGGIQLLIADNPATSIVGGIDASQWEWWRNTSVVANEQITSANIEKYMDQVMSKIYITGDLPDLIIADNVLYYTYKESLTANQRYTNSSLGDLGFQYLEYQGIPVVLYGGWQGTTQDGVPIGGVPDQHMYFINTEYMKLKVFESGNGKNSMLRFGDILEVPGRDSISMSIYWAGQLTTNKRTAHGVLSQGPIT